jgi:hypothetical protein
MTEIRILTEKNLRKILRPDDSFSPMIQMWYDRIHAYLQLIRMKDGKTNNTRNILRFARQQHISKPEELMMEELQDRLQFAWVRKADLQKQAKGLRKVHIQNCLINAIEKKQKSCAAVIKQKIIREESKRMWYLIKQTVKDPQSPSILKVQRVIDGKVKEYEMQEDIKNASQQECKVRFSLAHSAPITSTLLGKCLRYLSNKALARSIIQVTYKVSSDMDPAMKLILEEIGKLGAKLVNKEGKEIIITPEDFMPFWTRVGEFTLSSMFWVHYGHYKAAIECDISTKILAQQLAGVARSGFPPENWSVGLQVML